MKIEGEGFAMTTKRGKIGGEDVMDLGRVDVREKKEDSS